MCRDPYRDRGDLQPGRSERRLIGEGSVERGEEVEHTLPHERGRCGVVCRQ
jgi:hypothetical protein